MLPIDAPYKKEEEVKKELTPLQRKTIVATAVLFLFAILSGIGWFGYMIHKEGNLLQEQGGYYTVEGWKDLPSKE